MTHKHVLNLAHAHFTQVHGDITAVGTWYTDAIEGCRLPCLVLIPSRIWGSQRVVPCIIPLKNAWKWSEEAGDPAYCAWSVVQFAAALGLSATNEITAMRIVSVIRDHMGDLLNMPPAPDELRTVTADAIWKDESGKEHHKEIRDHV